MYSCARVLSIVSSISSLILLFQRKRKLLCMARAVQRTSGGGECRSDQSVFGYSVIVSPGLKINCVFHSYKQFCSSHCWLQFTSLKRTGAIKGLLAITLSRQKNKPTRKHTQYLGTCVVEEEVVSPDNINSNAL